MVKYLVAVAGCLKKRIKLNSREWVAFHFKGVFCGQIVKEIYVVTGSNLSFVEVGGEYILYLRVIGVKDLTLYTSLVRLKEIEDTYWN